MKQTQIYSVLLSLTLSLFMGGCAKSSDPASFSVSQASSSPTYAISPATIPAGISTKIALVQTNPDGSTQTFNTGYTYSFAGSQLSVFNNTGGGSITGYNVGQYSITATNNSDSSVVSANVTISAGAPYKLLLSSGNSQSAVAGSALAQPLAVSVQDNYGNPISGYTVNWTVVGGAGNLSAASSVSDATGIAKINYTLGTQGINSIQAQASTALTGTNSISFSETATAPANAPAKLAFSIQPGSTSTQNVVWATLPQVSILDSSNAVVTSAALPVTITAYQNSSCTTLATGVLTVDSSTVTSTSGISKFTGVKYDTAAVIYLKATSGVLTSSCSTKVTVNPPPSTPAKLTFTVQPTSGTQNKTLVSNPKISILDANGLLTSATDTVSISAYTDATCSTPATGTMTGASVAAVSGVATFTALTYSNVETIYLKATDGSLTPACSGAIAIAVDQTTVASKLRFQTTPTSEQAYTTFLTQPKISVVNSTNGLITTGAYPITLAAFSDSACTTPASGTLVANPLTVTSSAGYAQFAGTNYQGQAGTIYLRASTSGLTSVCSSAITITAPGAGTPVKLAFSTQPPSSGVKGKALTPAFAIQALDINNQVTTNALLVTLTAYSDAACTASAGTVTSVSGPGTITFSNAVINSEGTFYLKGTSGVLQATACSSAITMIAADHIVLVDGDNQKGTVGKPLAKPVSLKVVDKNNNPVSGYALNFAAVSGGASGSPSVAQTQPDGTAQFTVQLGATAGQQVSKAFNTTLPAGQQEQTFTATAYDALAISPTTKSLSVSQTLQFTVTGGSAPYTYSVTSGTGTIDSNGLFTASAVAESDTIQVKDSLGSVVTANVTTKNVQVTIINPVANYLANTSDVLNFDVNGTCSEEGQPVSLKIGNVVGSAPCTSGAWSATLNISTLADGPLTMTADLSDPNGVAATQAKVQFSKDATPPKRPTAIVLAPGTVSPSTSATPSFVVSGTEVGADVVLFKDSKCSIVSILGTAKASGTDTTIAASPNLSVAGIYTVYARQYDAAQNQSPCSIATVSYEYKQDDAPASIYFATQPTDGTIGSLMSAVSVGLKDSSGNPYTGAKNSITLTLNKNSFAAGTLTANASNVTGIANFSDLEIDTAAVGYTITATTGALSVTSLPFKIVAPTIYFATQPTDGMPGSLLNSVVVGLKDVLGNPYTGKSNSITLSLNKSSFNAGTLTKAASVTDGTAAFSDLEIDTVDTGYTITATANGASVVSNSFNIANATLYFVTQPVDGTAGVPLSSVVLGLKDSKGNPVAGGPITLTLSKNAFAVGTLSSNAQASDGKATFSDLRIDTPATGYTITATYKSSSIVSNSFNVGAPTLYFAQQPVDGTAGSPLAPVILGLKDTLGNPYTGTLNSITLTLNKNKFDAGTLTLNASPVDGKASFSDLQINKADIGYIITATSSGSSIASNSFKIGAAALATLDTSATPTDPQSIQTNATSSGLYVQGKDSYGNVIPNLGINFAIAPANLGTMQAASVSTGTNGDPAVGYFNAASVAGDATVTASSGALSATFTIHVLSLDPSSVLLTSNTSADSLTYHHVYPYPKASPTPIYTTAPWGGVSADFTGTLSVYNTDPGLSVTVSPLATASQQTVSVNTGTLSSQTDNVVFTVSALFPSSGGKASCSVTDDSVANLLGASIPDATAVGSSKTATTTFSVQRNAIGSGKLQVKVTAPGSSKTVLSNAILADVSVSKIPFQLTQSETASDQLGFGNIVYNNQIYFQGSDTTLPAGGSGTRVWRYCDGTASANCGPEKLSEFSAFYPIGNNGGQDGLISSIVYGHNLLFSSMQPGVQAGQFWDKAFIYCDPATGACDQSEINTPIYQLWNLQGSGVPDRLNFLAVYNNTVYFTTWNGSTTPYVMKHCQSRYGCPQTLTKLVFGMSGVNQAMAWNGWLYLVGQPSGGLMGLYKYCDGSATCGGVEKMIWLSKPISGTKSSPNTTAFKFFNNMIYFAAGTTTFVSGQGQQPALTKLYSYCDGSSACGGVEKITQESDIIPGGDDNVQLSFIYGNGLYYVSKSGLTRYCPSVQANCGTVGNVPVALNANILTPSNPGVAVYGNFLYYMGANSNGKAKLYRYCDGHAGCGDEKISQVFNLQGDSASDGSNYLRSFTYNNRLYIPLFDTQSGFTNMTRIYRICDNSLGCSE